MGHTAGLPGWEGGPLAAEQLADWELCTSLLAAQAPWWEPGTASGYHAVTQGYLIGEVVRRITGESIGSWFCPRGGQAPRRRLPYWPARVRGPPGLQRHPAAAHQRRRLRRRPAGVLDQDVHEPAHRCVHGGTTPGGAGPRSPPPTVRATPAPVAAVQSVVAGEGPGPRRPPVQREDGRGHLRAAGPGHRQGAWGCLCASAWATGCPTPTCPSARAPVTGAATAARSSSWTSRPS